MKISVKVLSALSLLAIVATCVGCGGGPCGELEKKKADCAKNEDAAAKTVCEKIIDEAVKAGNADACKAAVESIDKMPK